MHNNGRHALVAQRRIWDGALFLVRHSPNATCLWMRTTGIPRVRSPSSMRGIVGMPRCTYDRVRTVVNLW